MASCSSYRPVLPKNSSSLTHCSVYQPATRRPGCILAQSTGIWLTITRKKDTSDVRVTKSMCGNECWTDHRLLVLKLILPIQPQRQPQGKKLNKRLNVNKLSDKSASEDLPRELDCTLTELHLGQATIKEDWVVLRDKIRDTAFQLLGPTTRKNQEDWFDENDEEIKEMLADREESSSQNVPTRPIICSQKDSFHQHS